MQKKFESFSNLIFLLNYYPMIYRNQIRYIGFLFFSCFIFIAQQSFAQQVKKNYWDNGKVKSEGAYNNANMKVGKWKYYYQNGQLEVIGEYTGNKTDRKSVV